MRRRSLHLAAKPSVRIKYLSLVRLIVHDLASSCSTRFIYDDDSLIKAPDLRGGFPASDPLVLGVKARSLV